MENRHFLGSYVSGSKTRLHLLSHHLPHNFFRSKVDVRYESVRQLVMVINLN